LNLRRHGRTSVKRMLRSRADKITYSKGVFTDT
jgi:hypothetical protein